MIVSLQAVLDIAEAKKTAIAAFNVTNMESIMAAIAAAETLGQPLILQFCSSVHGKYVPMADIGPVMMVMAEKSTAPMMTAASWTTLTVLVKEGEAMISSPSRGNSHSLTSDDR